MKLYFGITGSLVENAQLALVAQGFKIAVDGKFGPATEDATKRYQAAHDLVADGVIGPLTAAKLGLSLVPANPAERPWGGEFVLGADLAHYQDQMGAAEWAALWARGFRWFYPKCTDGVSGPDSMFAIHKRLGKEQGMVSSAGYCFFRYDKDPIRQAERLVELTGGVASGELPHVLDVEWDNASKDKGYHDTNHASTRGTLDPVGEEMVYSALVRMETLSGMTPWIYTSAGFWVSQKPERFARFPVIIANYSSKIADDKIKIPAPWKRETARQYSGTLSVGKVKEIDGDRFLGTLEQLRAMCKA